MFLTSRLTVADYFKVWLAQAENEVKPNTYRSYYGNIAEAIATAPDDAHSVTLPRSSAAEQQESSSTPKADQSQV